MQIISRGTIGQTTSWRNENIYAEPVQILNKLDHPNYYTKIKSPPLEPVCVSVCVCACCRKLNLLQEIDLGQKRDIVIIRFLCLISRVFMMRAHFKPGHQRFIVQSHRWYMYHWFWIKTTLYSHQDGVILPEKTSFKNS